MSIVMGTAGHIDHGKTSLVKALTGKDCDRLEEEKKRGITIELGFSFLPLAVIPYYLFRSRKWRNGLLLVLSLLFYSWGEPKYVVMMLAATVAAYLGGLGMEALTHTGERGKKKAVFALTVCLVVLNLLFFKYTNFFWDDH